MSNQWKIHEADSTADPQPPFTMKRSAAQYAALSPLLDEALRLDDSARVVWLATLPDMYAHHRPALDRIFKLDNLASRRRLLTLELRLRSCGLRMGVLVMAEFDRRENRTV
jgi:hypothetical protein